MLLLLVFRRSRLLFGVLVCFTSESSKSSYWLSSNGCRCENRQARRGTRRTGGDGGGRGTGGSVAICRDITFLSLTASLCRSGRRINSLSNPAPVVQLCCRHNNAKTTTSGKLSRLGKFFAVVAHENTPAFALKSQAGSQSTAGCAAATAVLLLFTERGPARCCHYGYSIVACALHTLPRHACPVRVVSKCDRRSK